MMIYKNLQDSFFNSHDGNEIRKCIQCGTCSGSCPLSDVMDFGPRSLFALIRDGQMQDVINSNSPWMCVSCYQCTNRCPQEIPVTELMYCLKQLISQTDETTRSNKARDLHRAFSTSLKLYGRVTESFIMAAYSLKHPFAGLSNIPLALKLKKKRRIELKLSHIHISSFTCIGIKCGQ